MYGEISVIILVGIYRYIYIIQIVFVIYLNILVVIVVIVTTYYFEHNLCDVFLIYNF